MAKSLGLKVTGFLLIVVPEEGHSNGQYKTPTADPDCGPEIKRGLVIKGGLRTGYKTRTRYKTRTEGGGPATKRGLNTKHCEKSIAQPNSDRLTT